MKKTYKLINTDKKISIDFNKNQVIDEDTKFVSFISKIDKNVIYLAEKQDFQAIILTQNSTCILWEIDNLTLEQQYDLSGSAIYKIPKYKTLFFKVPKNACSTVVSELYNHFYKKWNSPKCTTADWIFLDIFPKINYKQDFEIIKQEYIKEEYKDWEKFIVYDDPLKRFLRILNHKYLKKLNFASIVTPDDNIEKYIDEMILTAQADCINSKFHDTHLTSISKIWGEFFDDITYFVNLEDLDAFLYGKFKIKAKRYLVTKEQKPITQETLTTQQIELIKDIYAPDYEIPIKYKNKFYNKTYLQ